MNALDLAEPLVDNLLKLEEGITMYDAHLGAYVLVMAPVVLIIADNPMSSDLCNHLGSTANKFCRMCLVKFNNFNITFEQIFVNNRQIKNTGQKDLDSEETKTIPYFKCQSSIPRVPLQPRRKCLQSMG